jgi:hypothetical protein
MAKILTQTLINDELPTPTIIDDETANTFVVLKNVPGGDVGNGNLAVAILVPRNPHDIVVVLVNLWSIQISVTTGKISSRDRERKTESCQCYLCVTKEALRG